MKPINESQLINSLDSGSTKRLREFRSQLKRDSFKTVFDDRIRDVILKYALYPNRVHSEIKYLDNLTDFEGVAFNRSTKQYEKMESTWAGFLCQEKSSFQWNRNYQTALKKVKDRYRVANLVAIDYKSDQDIIDSVTDWTTSSGFEGLITGKRKKVDFCDNVLNWWRDKAERAILDGSFNTPMIPGIRTQCSGEYTEHGERTDTCKHKTRPIWMVSLSTIIAERKWAKPLTQWLVNYSYSAIGKDDSYLTRWVANRRMKLKHFISLDYSAYDSSIPSWLIYDAFDVIAEAFGGISDPLFHIVRDDFIFKNLVTGDDVVYISHGNPSGSGFTAIVNGICNEIMTETWAAALGIPVDFNIMGDDNLIYCDRVSYELIHWVASYLLHNFGVSVNTSKSSWGDYTKPPEYLSRIWTDGGAYRHENILLSKMLFPEKFRNYSKDGTSPELVLYSYYLSYPMGLIKLIDMPRFLTDNRLLVSGTAIENADYKVLPYIIRQRLEATNS